jgi:DNA excision repair protein ERCC-8
MESLLLDRSLGNITHEHFTKLTTESLYFQLGSLDHPRFPLRKRPIPITCLDFDKVRSEFLLSGGADSSLKLWRVGTSEAELLSDLNKNNGGHQYGITMVQWWPHDTGMFLSSSYDMTLKVWNSNTLEEAFSFELNAKVNNFDINQIAGESLIAVGCDSTHVRILDLRSTSAAQSLSGHNGTILSCKWSPMDPFVLATGSSEGEVRIWDIRKTNACLAQLDLYRTDKSRAIAENRSRKVGVLKSKAKAHSHGVNGLCWMENGRTLITTGGDEKIRVWDLDVRGGINTLLNFGQFVKNKSPAYKSMILSPINETDVQYLWYPSDNGEVLVFRAMDGKLVSRLRRNIQNASRSTCLAYTGQHSATYLSGTVDGRIFVWGPTSDESSSDEED